MKKTLSILLVLACFLCLVACKNPVTPSPIKRADVNIRALSASVAAPVEVAAEVRNMTSKFVRLADGDETEPTTTVEVEHAQYIIMYKSEKDIKFTIELDNPKGQSIDAVELKCDDPNATILVSGEWEKLSSKDGYVVNWASENAYRKTYYLQTISQDSINTLTVSDIKVNGEWQNAALNNDQLKIYKMDDEDLKWDFISNTPSGYKWKFDCSEKVSNLVVKVGNDVLTADENGVYTVEHDCKVSWTWDYATGDVLGNGTEVVNHWDNERDIEVFKLEYLDGHALVAEVDPHGNPNGFIRIYITFSGTDVNTDYIIVNGYTLTYSFVGWYCYEVMDPSITDAYMLLNITVGDTKYTAYNNDQSLTLVVE